MHSLLGDRPDSPWEEARGQALERQALQEFRSSLDRIPDGPAADALERQLQEFEKVLQGVRRTDPRAELDLRVALFRLNSAALQVDQQARQELIELRRSQSEAYGLVLAVAAVLLGLINAAAVHLRRREAAAAAAQRQSELRFALLFEQNPEPTLVHTEGRVELANPAALRALGAADVEALQSVPLLDLVGRADRERVGQVLAGLDRLPGLATSPGPTRMRRLDGSEFSAEAATASFRQGKGLRMLSVFHDITDQLTREQELERRVQERTADLEQANADLQTFSDAVSHDLRAPLAAVDAFAETVLRKYGDALPPQARHYLERVVAGAASMTEMIEGLLELSRHARAPVQRRPLDLGRMAREAFELQAQALAGRRVEFLVAEGLQCSGDPVLVATLLQNLIGNAIKYSRGRDPARIEVGARHEGDELQFYVRDNGAGFDPAYADRLFKPFSRLHGTHEFEGHGIGLATVSRIVARHHGRIWAEGVEGEGATFWFTLSS